MEPLPLGLILCRGCGCTARLRTPQAASVAVAAAGDGACHRLALLEDGFFADDALPLEPGDDYRIEPDGGASRPDPWSQPERVRGASHRGPVSLRAEYAAERVG